MLHKEAKNTLRFLLKNYSKYGGMLFFDKNFKVYRYSDPMMDKFDEICGDDEKLFNDVQMLYNRHRSFLHFLKEVTPQWRVVETIHYADNSEEIKEVDKNGNVRYRMTVAPHGDLC